MKRRREADSDPRETATGRCPGCRPGDPFPCEMCDDSMVIRFPASWSTEDDMDLRRCVCEGRSWSFTAVRLRRPLAIVRARAARLKLVSIWDEPRGLVSLRQIGGGPVDGDHPPDTRPKLSKEGVL